MKIKSQSQKLENKPTATQNKAGGLAFNFESPAEYLLATIGSAMFAEPKYYADAEKVSELKERDFNTDGLDEQAIKILNASFAVAEGENPRDLLALAYWARKELNMRTTPQILLAVAGKCLNTKQFVRNYVPKIAMRADEVKQLVGAYEHLFGWGAFPACLKKGVADRMSTLTEYEILKYNTKEHPNFADILQFCERRKNYPLSTALRNYIITGEITDIDATPMLSARKKLNSLKKWTAETPALAQKAGATWENLISQFGSTQEVWTFASSQMGYMALLRNLANLLDANVSMSVIEKVAQKLADEKQVLNSKQLPFRFLSAYRILQGNRNINWDGKKVVVLVNALEKALDISVDNIPNISGSTLIATDNSGSMGSPISKNSKMTIRDVGNTLCAMFQKKCENVQVLSFGENVVPIILTGRNSILVNAEKIQRDHDIKGGGHSTNAWKVLEYAIKRKEKYDRIVVLSDMQCYNASGLWGYNGSKSVAELLNTYRKTINSNCYAHFFDLQGYGTKQTASGSGLDNIVAGFSEKIINQILVFEGTNETNEGEKRILPSLDYIRENY